MIHDQVTRRRLLQGTAGLAVAGLGGCLGASNSSSGSHESGHNDSEQDSHENPPGHGESEHSHDRVSEPQQTREVLVNTARGENTTEYHFKPHVTWVTVGGTVTWKLQSGTHTATAYHPGNDEPRLVPKETEAWDSGTLSEKGETYQHTFDKEGVYHYFCKPHEQFGMLGTVIVGKPHPDDQVALQTIPDNKPKEVRGKIETLNKMVRTILQEGHHEGGGGHSEEGHHDAETTEHRHHEGETTESDHHEAKTTEHSHHENETTATSSH